VVILVNAGTFVVAGLLILRVPAPAPRPHTGDGPRMAVLRDRPFVLVAAVHSLLALHFALLDVALPLWVVARIEAPTWVVAVLLLVNTVTVVAMQVRATVASRRRAKVPWRCAGPDWSSLSRARCSRCPAASTPRSRSCCSSPVPSCTWSVSSCSRRAGGR